MLLLNLILLIEVTFSTPTPGYNSSRFKYPARQHLPDLLILKQAKAEHAKLQ